MSGRRLFQHLHFRRAGGFREIAARLERAARRQLVALQQSAQALADALAGPELRDGGDEAARIGVPRLREELARRRDLHHVAGIHDADAIGDLRQQPQIMRDVEHRHAVAPPQLRQQRHDLLLRGDVEAGRRLVEHEQVGIAGQGHGDRDALLLAAGELVRIAPADAVRVRQAHRLEQFGGALTSRYAVGMSTMRGHHLGHLAADAHPGAQRRCGILRDQRDAVAAQSDRARSGSA